MRTVIVLVGLLLIFSSSTLHAGPIYGSLVLPTGPSPRVEIVIRCTSGVYRGLFEEDWSYRILVKERGRCDFQLVAQGQVYAATEVFSYDQPTRYDFELV